MSDAPHIYTLTGNLLAERTLEFAAWRAGHTQRASRETFQVGGKGINVSKMLNRLHAANTALCFSGGAPGAECETWLRAQRFAFHAFATDLPTRSGTVVRAADQLETTFLGPDASPSASALKACADFLDAQPAGRVLALCGSFPGWTEPSFDPLRAALERWLNRGILVADTYGAPLQWLARRPLALIKINAAEFRGVTSETAALPDALGRVSSAEPVHAWIVTDGPAAVWFARKHDAPASLAPPRVREVSATGSGDVLFAAVLDALFRRGLSLRDAVAAALPLAAANAAHPGIAEFPWEAIGIPPENEPARVAAVGSPSPSS
ncbi:MAG TPA: PfkB family carbohydrate kinase [Opitutus sp.]|nr:PfkB family carbohydrate kinase [Opitutus sp.]